MRPEVKRKAALVASTITVDVNWELPNCFVALKYYDADPSTGTANEVTPGAGTVVVKARIVVHDKFVDITNGTFSCTEIDSFASYIGNAYEIVATPTVAITTAVWYELVVTQNF